MTLHAPVKKGSLFVSALVLLIIIGFPRFYGTEFPMALLLIPCYMASFFRDQEKNISFFLVFLMLYSFWLLGGIASFLIGDGATQDIFFHMVVSAKILLNFFFGYVVYVIVRKHSAALLIWLVVQVFVISVSMFNADFYSVLLGFISPRSADVFQYVFGLRAVGFGLFHVDGALTLVIAVFYYLLISEQSFFKKLLLLVMLPVSMAVARSAIIPYVVLGLLKRDVLLKLSLLCAIVVMFVLSAVVTDGPIYEATEIFRNLLNQGSLHSESVASLADMYVFPESADVYVYGAGKYFDSSTAELAFYMGTDVGYLRLLFYSGIGSIFVFLSLNVFGLVGVIFSSSYPGSKDVKMFALALFGIFIMINFKGLQVMSIFAVVLYFYDLEKRREFIPHEG